MDEEQFNNMYQGQTLAGQGNDNAIKQAQQVALLEEKEKGIAESQLDVNEIKSYIHNILLGREPIINDYGKVEWTEEEGGKVILSKYGIKRIMQTVHLHINKNTLLSNFDVDQINRLMLAFTTELNDLILLKYEFIFKVLTFDECKIILLERIKHKKEVRMFALEMLGKKGDADEITKELVSEVEKNLEIEMFNIQEEYRRERVKEYGLLVEEIEAQVYATYNRAWKGEERGSLRRHTSFSEVSTPQIPQQKKGGLFSWLKG